MVEWDKIRVDYESSAISIRKLATNYGITDGAIRQKAKSLGWTRKGSLDKHIEKKAKAVMAVQAIEAEEQHMPIVTRMAVQQKVLERVSTMNLIASMQTGILDRLQGLIDHDAKVQLEHGEEVNPNAYGKAKIANDIIKDAKKTMLGDAPIIDMNEDLGKSDESEEWVVVIPAQEKKRLDEVDSENS
jgi:hypothetical protein